MRPTMATYFTYSEIMGVPRTTIEEFRSELGKFSRGPVIYACSVINNVLKDWQGHWNHRAHDELVKNSFPPEIANILVAAVNDARRPRGLYHRQQLLFVSKEAISVCPESGGKDPIALPYWGGLGMVLLMANDLLPKRLTNPAPTAQQMVSVLSEFIPIAEASGFYRPINKIVRSHLMLSRFFPGGSEGIRAIFHNALDIPLEEYLALCFATLVRYYDLNLEKYKTSPGDFLLTRSWYRTISLPQETVDLFLKDISASADELQAFLRSRNSGANDFTCFKDKPIFRDGETFFVVDPAFLTEKGETGTFWRISNALPREERLLFHGAWGTAFERYINWILSESVDGLRNRVYTSPKLSDTGEEVCDAIIVCDDSAIFLESKGATFTAEAKYGHDPAALAKEIEEKLIRTPEQKKGVCQLAARIELVFNRKSRRRIDGPDLARISKVFPLLVTRDDIGAALVMNAYLASKFRESLNRKAVSVTVTPLFSLSAQDIEMICGYLRDASFAALLEERYRNDKGLLSTFWAVDNGIVEGIGGRGCAAFEKAFSDYTRMVEQTLSVLGDT
ncbi:hypothetical protein SBA1_460008 [Candidatus Sulfotelmatobacter kueseliae]|uniref:NERD domain-containing protein n=1 Tax=Candidatus Sulfotelmatobacter kueseliae TaxID=2042962 RepID=A0A2U3KRZ8_9BACT|nr:hypothetical protein SBA1_460008 [Candidatus Sulfotelmatobacter kueseliae]